MESKKAAQLIEQLGEQMDLQEALEATGIAPGSALKALKSGNGKEQLRVLRTLTRIHIEVLANRYGPRALFKLCELLSNEKAELQMKVALAVLAIGGLDESAARRRGSGRDKGPEELQKVDSEQAKEVLRMVAEAMTRQRSKASMGTPPLGDGAELSEE